MLENLISRLQNPSSELDCRLIQGYCGEVPVFGNLARAFSLDYTLWYLIEGQVDIKTRKRSLTVTADHWVLTLPGTEKSQYFSPGAKIISLHFSLKTANADLVAVADPICVFPGSGLENLKIRSKELLDYVTGSQAIAEEAYTDILRYDILLYGWLLEFYSVVAAKGILRKRPEVIDLRVALVLGELALISYSGSLPYDRLEKCCSLSRVQIDRLLVTHTGMTPRKYHDRIILDRACRMLVNKTLCAKEIAVELGFASLPHFSAWFKRNTGMPPNAYRHSRTY